MNVAKLMEKSREAILNGNLNIASENLNKGIIALSQLTLEGVSHVDGASVDRWKERFWFQLETNDLIEE
ncbi:MAG: hypothetical protein ACOVK2_07380 [Candidatus Fonsibacter sp.]|jgi:hypothetical protein